MYVTQNDYYDLRGDFETVYAAAMDLDDRELLKKLLKELWLLIAKKK